ncbi:MAG: STAS domain-containing protein [Planctomycetia bacterium]|nr:STAS domain-containing protein [Planctomycetia bacterium]
MSSLSEFSPKYLRLQQADGETTVVCVAVELLTEDVNLEQFGHELFALVEQFGCRRMVVDLNEVRVVTSAGLGKMITLHRKMHRLNGSVVFCDVQPAVEDVLRTSRLITYLTVAPNREAALAALPKT